MFAHEQQLARLISEECMEQIGKGSLGLHVPIPVAGTPYFAYDGLFIPHIAGGTGFSSLSDLISEATTGGKRQDAIFNKTGTLATSAAWSSLWNVGPFPAAAGAPAAIPGGAVPTNATNGSFMQIDPGGTDTLHFTTAFGQGSAAPNTLLLYDRIFHAASVLHTSSGSQAVTGVPTRYTGGSSAGNFAFLEVTTGLGATAQTITMRYVDQDGNASENAAAPSIVASSVVTRIPHAPWFIPLNAGDTGLQRVTALTFSAGNTAGISNIVMGHPLAFIPCPAANQMVVLDGINSAFNFVKIWVGGCLALLEIKGVGTATTYNGQVILVSG